MRLICPNCGAQYEVDDRVIPDGGRDVQCSSCGHAWYQMPANSVAPEPPLSPDEADTIGPDVDAITEPDPEDSPEAPAADPSTGTPAEALPDTPVDAQTASGAMTGAASPAGADLEADADASPPTVATGPETGAVPRRELDENLRAILQEEVAREMAARATDTAPADTATDATTDATTDGADLFSEPPFDGVDDDAMPEIRPAPEADRDPADREMAGLAAAAVAADKPPRKDLFPDIEEINSTLDSHAPDDAYDDEAETVRRGGFGRGFFAVIFIAALALALYMVAPQLAETMPVLEPALTGYVGAVNAARDWLDATLQGLTARMSPAE